VVGWGDVVAQVARSKPEAAPNGGSLETIGARLRAARLERDISLREMARRINVSPSFVSQIELGKAKPSVGTLYAFVSEMNLSLDDLMTDEAEASARTQQRLNSLPQWTRNSAPFPWPQPASPLQPAATGRKIALPGVVWRRLTNFDDPMVDFLHVTYAQGGESCSDHRLMRHGGHEYGHVISGRLNVQVGFEHYDLGPGDSIHFDSATPHRLANDEPEDCVSIWVVVGRRVDPRVSTPDHDIAHLPELS
jgi:transcriptional regulator with XRE-family HTH domain